MGNNNKKNKVRKLKAKNVDFRISPTEIIFLKLI